MSDLAPAGPTIGELEIAADPARWRAAGFDVDSAGGCVVGRVQLRLTGEPPGAEGSGVESWSLRGATREGDIDGLRTARSDAEPPAPAGHPNGALSIDHVVVFTPDLSRTVAALEATGFDLRRVREVPGDADPPVRQAFFRVGEPILEVVGPVGDDVRAPAIFWGLVVVVGDLDEAVRTLGDGLRTPRDAVQPGRRIATVRDAAGLGVPVAFMTPHPPRA